MDGIYRSQGRTAQAKTEAVLATGAKAIFSAETIDPGIFHALTGAGCFVLGGLERSGVNDIAQASGATLCDHLDDVDSTILGQFQRLEIETSEGLDGRRERLCIRVGEHAGFGDAGCGWRRRSGGRRNDTGTLRCLAFDLFGHANQRCCSWRGSIHMGAALAVKEAAEHEAGRERLAMEAFGRALENLLRPLHKTQVLTDWTPCWRCVQPIVQADRTQALMRQDRSPICPRHGFLPIPCDTHLKPPLKPPVDCSALTRSSQLEVTEFRDGIFWRYVQVHPTGQVR